MGEVGEAPASGVGGGKATKSRWFGVDYRQKEASGVTAFEEVVRRAKGRKMAEVR